MQNYTGKNISDQSTIKKKYISVIYNEIIDHIRKNIGEGPIYISIHEITEVEGRYVANVLFVIMHKEKC